MRKVSILWYLVFAARIIEIYNATFDRNDSGYEWGGLLNEKVFCD
jgi:hypothetical protein